MMLGKLGRSVLRGVAESAPVANSNLDIPRGPVFSANLSIFACAYAPFADMLLSHLLPDIGPFPLHILEQSRARTDREETCPRRASVAITGRRSTSVHYAIESPVQRCSSPPSVGPARRDTTSGERRAIGVAHTPAAIWGGAEIASAEETANCISTVLRTKARHQ